MIQKTRVPGRGERPGDLEDGAVITGGMAGDRYLESPGEGAAHVGIPVGLNLGQDGVEVVARTGSTGLGKEIRGIFEWDHEHLPGLHHLGVGLVNGPIMKLGVGSPASSVLMWSTTATWTWLAIWWNSSTRSSTR